MSFMMHDYELNMVTVMITKKSDNYDYKIMLNDDERKWNDVYDYDEDDYDDDIDRCWLRLWWLLSKWKWERFFSVDKDVNYVCQPKDYFFEKSKL